MSDDKDKNNNVTLLSKNIFFGLEQRQAARQLALGPRKRSTSTRSSVAGGGKNDVQNIAGSILFIVCCIYECACEFLQIIFM